VADDHERPVGATDDVVAAVGKASEAFEQVERARGALYEFHQLMGGADLLFGEAIEMLEAAGCTEQGARWQREVVGRNVLDGRWTFQIVEEFDDHYYEHVRDLLRALEGELMEGRRHVYESEMKDERRSHGLPGHERRPPPMPAAD